MLEWVPLFSKCLPGRAPDEYSGGGRKRRRAPVQRTECERKEEGIGSLIAECWQCGNLRKKKKGRHNRRGELGIEDSELCIQGSCLHTCASLSSREFVHTQICPNALWWLGLVSRVRWGDKVGKGYYMCMQAAGFDSDPTMREYLACMVWLLKGNKDGKFICMQGVGGKDRKIMHIYMHIQGKYVSKLILDSTINAVIT